MSCEYCRTSPHLSGCPYAPESPVVKTCDRCGEPIRAGDEYYEKLDGDILCECCTDNMGASREALKYFGCIRYVAEV